MRGLRLKARNGAGDMVLSVEGEIDFATAPELEAALEGALEPRRTRLLVDLRRVTFMDSTGLVLLHRHDRTAAAAGQRLVVIKGPPDVQRVFEVTGLSDRLTMLDEPSG